MYERGQHTNTLPFYLGQHRTIPALRLKHRSGSRGTASALPKCSIMSGCGTRIVLRGQKPLALCDRCPCFGSLFPPLAALTFAASSIICAFGLAAAAPRSPYRHLELCGIALGSCCAMSTSTSLSVFSFSLSVGNGLDRSVPSSYHPFINAPLSWPRANQLIVFYLILYPNCISRFSASAPLSILHIPTKLTHRVLVILLFFHNSYPKSHV